MPGPESELVTTTNGKWIALALVLAGTYAYGYSDLVVRRIGVYVYVAVFTLLWAEVLFIAIVAEHIRIPMIEVVIISLALTGLVLWTSLKTRRWLGLGALSLGTAVLLGIYFWLVP